MPSSETPVAALAAALLAGCAAGPAPDCRSEQQKAVVSHPWHDAALRSGRLLACSEATPAAGLRAFEVRYAGGAWWRVTRQPALEAARWQAWLPQAGAGEARALLRAVELAEFGPDGCGIDPAQPELRRARAADGLPAGDETVWRGTRCQCSASWRVPTASGPAAGLLLDFRSAC